MPSGCHHLTYGERCQIYALRKSGLSDSGHCPADRPGPDDCLARDPAQRRRARLQAQAGAGQGLGAARRRLVRCQEDDAGSGGGRRRTGLRRAGARTGPPAASARRASRWRAGSGYASTSAPTGRPAGGSTCSCAAAGRSRTGRADAIRAGAASRAPGAWIRHHRAIFGTRAARSLRKWPVLHFGVEVGHQRSNADSREMLPATNPFSFR